MSFTEVQARKDDAVFRRFGEDAGYVSRFGERLPSVRVIRKRPDENVRFSDHQIITPTCSLKVRRSEVRDLQAGDRFVFLDEGTEVEYLLHGEPLLNPRRTVWSAGADVVEPSR
jgi:hypothetical protein